MYYTYVLYSERDRQWYTGMTQDLKARWDAHTTGRVWSTRSRRPLQLVYYEACRRRENAVRRERYLKSGRGKRYLRQRLGVELVAISRDKLERHKGAKMSARRGQARLLRCSQRGQGTLEYLLVLIAIMLALIYGARQNGPIQSGVSSMLTATQAVIANAAQNAANRFTQ